MTAPKTMSILSSIVMTSAAWMLCDQFSTWISGYLMSILKPMSSWSLSYPIFALSIGHIPLTSFLVWKRTPKATYLTLISYWLIAWSMLIIICILAFVLADVFVKPESAFLPDYIVWIPFLHYWNVVLPLASIAGSGLLFLVTKKTHMTTTTNQKKVIDQNDN